MLSFFIFFWLAEVPDSLLISYLETGKIVEAEQFISSHPVKDTFLLAEFAYFTYKFEEATELYKKISPTSLQSNNALERVIIIQECSPSELQSYVRAELLGRQGKRDEGIGLLKKLKQNDSPIASYSSFLLIQFFDTTGRYENSIKECQEFIIKYPEHSKLPEILLKEADVYARIGNSGEAKKIYKEILLKHPKSAVTSIARMRLE